MSAASSEKILIIEDNKALSAMLRGLVLHYTDFTVDVAVSLQDCRNYLQQADVSYAVAIADLNLPDADDGEVVELLNQKHLPTIVLTGSYSQSLRDQVSHYDIIDYVIKDSVASYEYIISLIKRVIKNRHTRVLVVDDSPAQRKLLAAFMRLQLFKVVEAENGLEALAKLREHDDIKLILTDYHMPQMDGFELTGSIRKLYPRERYAIIGLSGKGEANL